MTTDQMLGFLCEPEICGTSQRDLGRLQRVQNSLVGLLIIYLRHHIYLIA